MTNTFEKQETIERLTKVINADIAESDFRFPVALAQLMAPFFLISPSPDLSERLVLSRSENEIILERDSGGITVAIQRPNQNAVYRHDFQAGRTTVDILYLYSKW
jgi:hypothetical protein